jgi:predicted translin family RNA/ssDNA-binding protein
MIVGEALNRRSDLQKGIAQLQERLRASVLVREGDEPPESADELLDEVGSLCDELQRLLAQINHTNASTNLSTGETVTEGLARRDVLALRQGTLRAAVRAATNDGLARYSRSEVRMVRQIRVSEIQERLDAMSKERRELDNQLQEHNWTTSLVE